MICFQISIFEPLNTAKTQLDACSWTLWFAFKLVSLNHWIQPHLQKISRGLVVICFQISIFEPLNTAAIIIMFIIVQLWFAFKLVSLNHWIQQDQATYEWATVVICFQISIFEPLNTAHRRSARLNARCDLLSN